MADDDGVDGEGVGLAVLKVEDAQRRACACACARLRALAGLLRVLRLRAGCDVTIIVRRGALDVAVVLEGSARPRIGSLALAHSGFSQA